MNRLDRERLLQRLRADGARIADHFGLQYSAIEAEHPRVKGRYGSCFATGLVKIRLNHARTGAPLKYSSLIDTLCHELAHLRHFDHGPAFKRFFLQLLGWARRQGIYCPSNRPQRRPAGLLSAPAILAPRSPPQRNGVPVFAAPETHESRQGRRLPWEPRPPVTTVPATASVPRSIVSLPAARAGTSGADRETAQRPPETQRRQRPPKTQLSLF